jgi:hypothetical protein
VFLDGWSVRDGEVTTLAAERIALGEENRGVMRENCSPPAET